MRPALALRLAVVGAVACAPPTRWPADEHPTAGVRPSVEAARELDQSGVKSFGEGRYADAARFFRAALDMGGPSSELWNIARCLERLDDAQGASSVIQEYLGRRDISPRDRAEAERENQTLRGRPSVLTVTTSPAGAQATLDGARNLGATPVSVEVSPGAHEIAVRHPGYTVETRRFEARFGRAVIVSLDLVHTGK